MEFVCDYCNNVVSLRDKQCNSCGFVFSNIRCPVCSFVGIESDFRTGCPICHYEDSLQRVRMDKDAIEESSRNLAKYEKKKRSNKIFLRFLFLFIFFDIILMWYVIKAL